MSVENPEWQAAAQAWETTLWAKHRFQRSYPRDFRLWPAWLVLCDREEAARKALNDLRQYVA